MDEQPRCLIKQTSIERNLTTVSYVWNHSLLRKIFLDIINGTQLRKCRQLRGSFIKKMDNLVNQKLSDTMIYEEMHRFIHHDVHPDVRKYIQHQGHYRGINRSTKIVDFAREHHEAPIERILDIGCGDGSITKVLQQRLQLDVSSVHGCDINPIKTDDFTFTLIPEIPNDNTPRLPYPDGHFNVVYALMSLHHIRNIESMLTEIHRVLAPNGLVIIREHDCVTNGLGLVLDVIHGFYSMVWSNPKELKCFHEEYWANYRTAKQLDILIESSRFTRITGTNRDENYPIYYHGKVINPLKHYWAIYRRCDHTSFQSDVHEP